MSQGHGSRETAEKPQSEVSRLPGVKDPGGQARVLGNNWVVDELVGEESASTAEN